MKIAEEQKKQFIILCCLVVFILAFAVIKIVGSGSHAQTRQTQSAVKKTVAGTEKDVDANAGSPEAAVVVATEPVADAAVRDPFVPQIDLNVPVGMSVQTKLPPPVFPAGKLSGLGPIVPPMSFTRDITVTTNDPSAKEPDPDPSQTLRLTGIIQGAVNVAILRGADNARYIVREGQSIDGKYRVDLVTRFGVRLSHNGNSYLLSLGGSDVSKGAQ